jgi:site-specific recombinase XerD
LSFDALCELYLTNYARKAKASWKQDESLLRLGARPVWGKREAATITRRDAAGLLYELANRAPVTANRLRSVLRRMFGWAIDSALLDHDHNPLTDVRKPHREHGKPVCSTCRDRCAVAFEATSFRQLLRH